MNPGDFPPSTSAAPFGAEPAQEGLMDGNFLRSTWLAVYERKWYALAVFVLSVLAAVAYTFLSTPMYNGVVTVQVLKHGAQVLRGADVVENSITNDVDFNTQIRILDSLAIVQSVAQRLTPDELNQLTEPYKSRSQDSPNPSSIILAGRKTTPQRLTLIANIQFRHPSPRMAARVANLFASEYIAYNSRLRVEESLKAVDDLKDRADQQRKRVDEIANALQAYRQRGNLISLMQSKDIVTDKLKALNQLTTQTNARLKEAEIRWRQVEEWTREKRDLSELSFIATNAKVSQLLLQVSSQKLALSQLQERYKSKHPRLIEATNGLAQSEQELRLAVDLAAASVKADHENAKQTDEAARTALAEQETRSLDLDKSSVEYENLNREFRVNEQLLESMMSRMRAATITSSIEIDQARIVDRAAEPTVPVSPKLGVNLAIGIFGGLFLGFGFALGLATIDDRVKTTFDVETLVGLPLLGVIPRAERMEQPDKAQLVASGADRMIGEAFLSVYSTLRVAEESRNAKLLLVTSTLPGEGKSFVATNLALTFASQGQKTAIVDCDLRRPNVDASFRLDAGKGIINYCLHGARLEDIMRTDVYPNLDVLTVGGRAKNPIQLLNSPGFEGLVAELNSRYERVIFDTPPLGAVSDALNIMSLMDGAIFVTRYGAVKRAAMQSCVQRLRRTNIPVFGAILNDMTGSNAGDYYRENTKLFRKYYHAPERGTGA